MNEHYTLSVSKALLIYVVVVPEHTHTDRCTENAYSTTKYITTL